MFGLFVFFAISFASLLVACMLGKSCFLAAFFLLPSSGWGGHGRDCKRTLGLFHLWAESKAFNPLPPVADTPDRQERSWA